MKISYTIHIDDARKITEWIEVMTVTNKLLKEIDIKAYRDEWRPRLREKVARKVLNMDIDVEEPAKEVKKAQELSMPPLRSPRGKRGIKRSDGVMLNELGGMKSGDNDVGKRQKERKKDPKAAVMKMLGNPSKGDKDGDAGLQEETKKDTKWIQNIEIWRNGMLERVRKEKQPFEHWSHEECKF